MFPDLVRSLRLDAPAFEPAPDADWAALLDQADAHSLTPLLYTAGRERGWLRMVPTEAAGRMAKAFGDNALRQANVRAELLEIDSILTEARVPHIVLKGWPVVERLYADPAQRVMYDHDFLLPAEAAQAGHAALRAAGFGPVPVKDAWVEKHLPALWRNEGYVWDGYLFDPDYPRPVELHVQLWDTGWRGLRVGPLPDVWSASPTRTVAGRPMRVLSDADTIIHLAMHFAGHWVEREARLNQLLDVARWLTLPEARGEAFWETVVARASAAGVGRFVYASVWLAREVFGAPLPPAVPWQQLARATPLKLRAWLAAHGAADALESNYRRRNLRTGYELTFLAAASPAERLGILRFAAFPNSAHLMAKYGLHSRCQAVLYYPRYVAERMGLVTAKF